MPGAGQLTLRLGLGRLVGLLPRVIRQTVADLRYLADGFDLHLLSNGSSLHLLSAEKHSALAWRLARRVARQAPGLFTRGLASKTLQDHGALRQAATHR